MMNRKYVATVSLALLTLLLAACGAAATPPAAEVQTVEVTKVIEVEKEVVVTATPVPAEPVTLNVWIMPNGPQPLEIMQQEAAEFQKLHPNITVEVEVIDWGAAWSKITTAATGGEGPDISQLGTTWVGAISAMGALRPFSPEEIATVGGGEAFVEASWQTCNPVGSGFTTCLPWFVDTRAIVYRTDALAQAGLDPEQAFADWESFDDALAQLKEADLEMYPIAFPGKNDWNVLHNFAPWVWEAGGDMLNPGNTAAVFNSPEGIEGVEFYASLYTKGYTPEDALELNSAQIDGRFGEGQVAMVISGPWLVKNSQTPSDAGGFAGTEAAENLAVHQIPAGPAGRYTFVGGSNLTVWRASQHPAEAVEFVKFLVAKESQARYSTNIGMIPARKEALADPTFSDDPNYSVFVEAVDNGKSYPAIAAWGPLETAMVKHLGALWDDVAGVNGPFDPATMIPTRLNEAVREVDTLLATAAVATQ
ncbi:MAG: sugar ABC transporter substrate-binding protein [Anaerolineae bacterium]